MMSETDRAKIAELVKYCVDQEFIRRDGSIREAVKETLTHLGFHENPQEVQKDIIYLNNLRKGSEKLRLGTLSVIIATMSTAGLYIMWEGFKSYIRGER